MNYYRLKNIKNLLEHKIAFTFAILLTVAITVGSLAPTTNPEIKAVLSYDKLVHGLAYCILTLSWFFAFKKSNSKKIISIAILIFLYGIIIEVLQNIFTQYRKADLLDILANGLGVFTAFFLIRTIFINKKLY